MARIMSKMEEKLMPSPLRSNTVLPLNQSDLDDVDSPVFFADKKWIQAELRYFVHI